MADSGPATPAALYQTKSISEAAEIIFREVSPLASISWPMSEAGGMVLAEDVLAQEPLPPFPASIKVWTLF